MAQPGFRILPFGPQPDPALLSQLAAVATAHLSDNMHRMQAVAAEIRPYHKGGKLIGPALTVRVPPGDNLMVHKAIDMARPGDVIVVDAGGITAQAIIGEIMSLHAETRGVAGMIIDGAIRDAGALAASAFPVYARGVTHRGPYKNGPGEINVDVSIGGLVIHPGDIVVGDEDGLLALSPEEAPALAKAAAAYLQKELDILADIRAGRVDRAWVDAMLEQKGCKPQV
jgi:RraA family protein